ncbi:hypothetical protein BVG16_00150 [Paenibacillus selenitireducens]|uniref:Uncharacterized protein n=1 Tax=Paenibacillus selenitireducens TaxID=1324314 RepID=A0A1T2XLW9_9BACL|nr:hypothetical protein BVG16_00150 [Paenibacillus selenitireducens]
MHFTMQEKFGDKPVSDWMETRLKAEVLQVHGVVIQVTVHLANATMGSDGGDSVCKPTPGSSAPSTHG